MITHKHILTIKSKLNSGKKSLSLTAALMCDIALGEKFPESFQKEARVAQAFTGLRRYRFIIKTKENNYKLTQKGKDRLKTIVIDDIEIKYRKHWDKKWYLVMFDFPIRFKKGRNAFRWKLKDLGFIQLQKSAWIYPFPCQTEIELLTEFYGITKFVEILVVEKITNDKKLRAYFGL